MSASVSHNSGWATRLEFRQLPPDAGDVERLIHDLNKRQLPGPGWSAILDELHEGLLALDPDYSLIQVKEKFGYAQVRAEVEPQADELIVTATRRSAVTCEGCGEPGELREERQWRLTLCALCDLYHPDGRPLPNEWPDVSRVDGA